MAVRGSEHSSQPLRIVHAVRSDAAAGVERYIHTIARELAIRGHQVSILGGREDVSHQHDGGKAIPWLPAATTTAVASGLVRRARHADVIHVHMTAAEWAATVTRPVTRRPVVATRHFAAARGSTLGGRLAAPLIARSLAAEIAVSHFAARASGSSVTRVILSGVPDASQVSGTGRVVLVAQRLEPEKRTEDALGAWRLSNLAEQGWRLLIAGEGSERSRLERIAAEGLVAGVEFLGRVADLTELREAAGIFLSTSPIDSFGLSAAEALAAGLPVVAASSGGHLETVGLATPETLYPSGDIVACAQHLQRLASDEAMRRSVGERGRRFQQEHLTLARHVDGIVDVYYEVVQHAVRPATV